MPRVSMALSCSMEDVVPRLRNMAFGLLPSVVVVWAAVTVLGGASGGRVGVLIGFVTQP